MEKAKIIIYYNKISLDLLLSFDDIFEACQINKTIQDFFQNNMDLIPKTSFLYCLKQQIRLANYARISFHETNNVLMELIKKEISGNSDQKHKFFFSYLKMYVKNGENALFFKKEAEINIDFALQLIKNNNSPLMKEGMSIIMPLFKKTFSYKRNNEEIEKFFRENYSINENCFYFYFIMSSKFSTIDFSVFECLFDYENNNMSFDLMNQNLEEINIALQKIKQQIKLFKIISKIKQSILIILDKRRFCQKSKDYLNFLIIFFHGSVIK